MYTRKNFETEKCREKIEMMILHTSGTKWA